MIYGSGADARIEGDGRSESRFGLSDSDAFLESFRLRLGGSGLVRASEIVELEASESKERSRGSWLMEYNVERMCSESFFSVRVISLE